MNRCWFDGLKKNQAELDPDTIGRGGDGHCDVL